MASRGKAWRGRAQGDLSLIAILAADLVGPSKRHLTQFLFAVIWSTAGTVLWLWHAGKGFFESLNFSILMWFWLIIAAVALRIIYFPVQYLRHKWALLNLQRREQRLAQKAANGDAHAAVLLHIKSGTDPREVPWWRW
jgi:hypothetical protein